MAPRSSGHLSFCRNSSSKSAEPCLRVLAGKQAGFSGNMERMQLYLATRWTR